MLNPPSLPSQISGGAFSIQTYRMFGTNKLFLHISLENLRLCWNICSFEVASDVKQSKGEFLAERKE